MQIVEKRAEQLAFADDLDLIAAMTADFVRSHDIAEILRLGLERISTRLSAEAASLFLLDPASGDLVCQACWGPTDVTGLRLPKGQGIVWRTVDSDTTQLVKDTRADPDFAARVDAATGFTTRSILCAPMSVQGERLGAIELFNKTEGGHFNTADRKLLTTLAASAALAMVNARMASAMAEQEAFKRELELAADIQRAMLPPRRPAGFPCHGVNLAARVVSGDFFDVLELDGGRLAFTIGDVSGKGVNASLLMAKTASLFRCLSKRMDSPGAIVAAIDSELAETNSSGMFVTMVVGVLDRASGRVVLANAGHEPPLVHRGGRFFRVEDGMPPVGVLPDLFADGCPESVVDLDGGALYLFTDGLTEAQSADGAMLGGDGVEDLLSRHAALPLPERLEAVVADVARDGLALKDDLTMVVVEDRR